MFEPGREVRVALIENELTQVWLIGKLRERGIITDKSELSSILKGTRTGEKAEQVIEESKNIIKEHKKWMQSYPKSRVSTGS